MGLNTQYETRNVVLSDILDELDDRMEQHRMLLLNTTGEESPTRTALTIGKLQGLDYASRILKQVFGGLIGVPEITERVKR